jgi:hypothetical protein
MTLLHHPQTVPKKSAAIPFWSLTLPRWAVSAAHGVTRGA